MIAEVHNLVHRLSSVIAFLFAAQIAMAQTSVGIASLPDESKLDTTYAIPGCRLLWKEEIEIQKYLQSHPESWAVGKLSKTSSWGFKVGDTHQWWATNFVTGKDYQVASTCRAVGDHAYIFTEDSLWTSGRITQAGVDSVRVSFDLRTPASPDKGIYQLTVETFGDPPDVDHDPKIIILILDIRDGFSGSGAYVAGYFSSANELTDGAIYGRRSNECEIYYLDGYPSNLMYASGLTTAGNTTAHEFQHMIHFNHDPYEMVFVNESCSETASLVCGYPYSDYWQYLSNTDIPLFPWNGTMADYSRAARWGLYLWKQFPNGYLKLLVADQSTGITGINNSLAQYPTSRRFNDIFNDWLIANYINDAKVDPRYSFSFPIPGKVSTTSYLNPIVPQGTSTVSRLAADYLSFTRGAKLIVDFATASADISVKAIEIGPGSTRVIDVSPNAQFNEPLFGTTYTEVTFVISNLSETKDATYSSMARGAAELKWEDNEPQTFLDLSPLDTLCVTFDAVPGARLDSVRVALRRAGSVTGGVWNYTGVSRPSPLGKPLAVPITATTSLTPPIVYSLSAFPFANPYPNWKTIDLHSSNISTDQPFVVGFWLGADTSHDARVMVTRYPTTSPYHSYTYLNNPAGSTPGWYYMSAGGGQIFIYHIRAYLSQGLALSLPVVPTLLLPADGTSLLPINSTLSWEVSFGATSYHLQVSTSSGFTSKIVDDSTITATSRSVGPLSHGTTYYWRVHAKNDAGSSEFSPPRRFVTVLMSLVKDGRAEIPRIFELSQNYPNPFNPSTVIRFALPRESHASLKVYDLLGREIATLVSQRLEPGYYGVTWQANVPSGSYVYQLQAGGFVETKKMILLH